MMSPTTAATLGRVALIGAFLALIGAWYTQISNSSLFGMSQIHLFSDAIVLSLLGIAGLIDAQLHAKKI